MDRVLVMDNGVADSDPACVVLGNGGQGTIMSLKWALANPLQHPNCLRATGAAFPDDGPIDTAAEAAWRDAGGSGAVIPGTEQVGVTVSADAKVLYDAVPETLRQAAEQESENE